MKPELQESFYVHDGPTPGATLIYVGSRDTKPWDSRASTKPLDGTPFTRNGFTMYAEIEENVDVQGSFESQQCCEKQKQRDMFETFNLSSTEHNRTLFDSEPK